MSNTDDWNILETMGKAMAQTVRAYEKTGVKPWSASTALVDLAYQAGGLLKLKMQLDQERVAPGVTRDQIVARIEVELAEILGLSCFIAQELKLDLARGFDSMLADDARKIRERTSPR